VKHVDLVGLHVEADSGAPLLLLREQDEPHRVLPIFIGGPEAASIALALSGRPPPRPITHDLLAALIETLEVQLERVEVTEVRDGTFIAVLSVTGPSGDHRVDSRPSDAIALAVRVDAPLFVSDDVLDEAGAVLTEAADEADEVDQAEAVDEEAIEDEVAQFRSFLDALDPSQFGAGPPDEGPAPPADPHGDDESPDQPDDAEGPPDEPG
jgi:bifunctional DNase/RNase